MNISNTIEFERVFIQQQQLANINGSEYRQLFSGNTEMRWMRRRNSRPFHPQSAGTAVALKMSQVFRLSGSPCQQVLRPSRTPLL